jgi:hypothetical protein
VLAACVFSAAGMASLAPASLDNQVTALQARLAELQKQRRFEQIDCDKRIAELQNRSTLSVQVQQRLERCEASLLLLLVEVKSWVNEMDDASQSKFRESLRRQDVSVIANM